MCSVELGWNCKKPIVDMEDATQVVSLHFPVDVEFPETVGTEFKTTYLNGTIKLFSHKRFISSMMNSTVVQIMQPKIDGKRNGIQASFKNLWNNRIGVTRYVAMNIVVTRLTFSQSFFIAFFFS